MSAIETFTFGGYTVRPANEFDRCLARRWTKADPHHANTIDPDFWIEQKFGHDAYVMFQGEETLFFFKLVLFEEKVAKPGKLAARWVELFIQFPPLEQEAQARRLQAIQLMAGMRQGFNWLERVLTQIRIQCVFFHSTSESLIAFCTRTLGFIQEGEMLRKQLSPDICVS